MPVLLTLEDVLELHAGQIRAYGGSDGLRSSDLLQSAIAQPEVTFGGKFLHTDMFLIGAAYLFHLVQNHPFVDGNKRIGLEAAPVFLELNGQSIEADDEQLVELVLGVARGQIDKTQIAEFFRNHAVAHRAEETRSAFRPENFSHRCTITPQYSGSSSIRNACCPVCSAPINVLPEPLKTKHNRAIHLCVTQCRH